MSRTYLNFEKSHIDTLLAALQELKGHRGYLNSSEQFVEMLLNEALDKMKVGW
jgi:hypothetical protein